MAKRSPHTGTKFDDVVKDKEIFEKVQCKALKRGLGGQIIESMLAAKIPT